MLHSPPPTLPPSDEGTGSRPADLAKGARLGPYEVVSLLGKGGMGEVYRARDPRLGRDVAIKVVAPGLTKDDESRRRFEREARAVAALSHPNIVAIHDVGDEQGRVFAVTELLEGETLRERLHRGALPWPRAAEIGAAIADALAAAHAKGVVHRDLKPANVFLTVDGRVKVLDFGLAKLTEPAEASDSEARTLSRTQAGTLLGTVGYMAPEQARGPEGRRAGRHLRAGVRAARDDHGPARIRSTHGRRDDRGDPQRGAVKPSLGCDDATGRDPPDRVALPREEPAHPLPVGARCRVHAALGARRGFDRLGSGLTAPRGASRGIRPRRALGGRRRAAGGERGRRCVVVVETGRPDARPRRPRAADVGRWLHGRAGALAGRHACGLRLGPRRRGQSRHLAAARGRGRSDPSDKGARRRAAALLSLPTGLVSSSARRRTGAASTRSPCSGASPGSWSTRDTTRATRPMVARSPTGPGRSWVSGSSPARIARSSSTRPAARRARSPASPVPGARSGRPTAAGCCSWPPGLDRPARMHTTGGSCRSRAGTPCRPTARAGSAPRAPGSTPRRRRRPEAGTPTSWSSPPATHSGRSGCDPGSPRKPRAAQLRPGSRAASRRQRGRRRRLRDEHVQAQRLVAAARRGNGASARRAGPHHRGRGSSRPSVHLRGRSHAGVLRSPRAPGGDGEAARHRASHGPRTGGNVRTRRLSRRDAGRLSGRQLDRLGGSGSRWRAREGLRGLQGRRLVARQPSRDHRRGRYRAQARRHAVRRRPRPGARPRGTRSTVLI